MILNPEKLADARVEAMFACEQVPFYQRAIDRIGLEDREWTSLPTARKSDYRGADLIDMLASGRTRDDPWMVLSHSSGSEGARVVSVCARVLLTRRWLNTLSIHPGFSFPQTVRGYKTARLAAPSASDPDQPSAAAPLRDRVVADRTLLLPASDDPMATTSLHLLTQAARELAEYAPDLLYVDPNLLALLLRARGTTALPAVRAIACTNVMLTHCVRRQIASAFSDTPVSEVVSMSELGWLGMECAHGTLHLNAKSFLHELLIDPRAATDAGPVGELCVTTLGDQVQPRIRYCTGDLYRALSTPCPCGHRFPAVRMEGRASNVVRTHDAMITPRQIDDAIGAPAGLVLYQLAPRDRPHSFVLRCVVADDSIAGDFIAGDFIAGDSVRNALASLLGTDDVSVERTSYLASERSGKLAAVRLTR